MIYRRIEFSSASGWRGRIGMALAAALGIGLAIALVLFGLILAAIILPILLIVGFIARWRWQKVAAEMHRSAEESSPEGPVIELDYEVVREGPPRNEPDEGPRRDA